MIVYVAGPYRGANAWDIERNIQRAEAISARLWEMGHVPVCPHLLTRNFAGLTDEQVFLDGLIELMRRCDCVLVIARSAGTDEEIIEATKVGLPVYWTMAELIKDL